jgi:hypothetical protein
VSPAESPLSPAKVAPVPWSSSLATTNILDDYHAMKSHLLDAQQRVVFGDSLTPGRGTSLNLANAEGDREVRDDGVLGLTASVRDHDTPTVGLGELSTESCNA